MEIIELNRLNRHQNYKLRFFSLDIYTLTVGRLEDREFILYDLIDEKSFNFTNLFCFIITK